MPVSLSPSDQLRSYRARIGVFEMCFCLLEMERKREKREKKREKNRKRGREGERERGLFA